MAAHFVVIVTDEGARKLSWAETTADAARARARIAAFQYASETKHLTGVEAIVYAPDGVSIFEVTVIRKARVPYFRPVVVVAFDARSPAQVAARQLS